MSKRINIGHVLCSINNHLNDLYVVSNKDIGPGKNTKLITVGPTFISDSRVGADYSFELISIKTYVSQFIGHNKIFLGSVVTLLDNTVEERQI